MNIYGIRFKILVFSIVISFIPIVFLSYIAYYYAKVSTEEMITSQLVSIADLKKGELVSWVNKNIQETITISKYPNLRKLISAPHQEKIPHYLQSILNSSSWDEIFLIDTKGEVLFSSVKQSLHQKQKDLLVGINLVEGEVLITEYYLNDQGKPSISFITPIPEKLPTSYLVIEANLNHKVLPLINNWPGMGYTGETLIVSQKEDEIIFINRLRHRPDSEKPLKISTKSKNALPAIFASSGEEGVIRTSDYRGIEVLAVYRHIAILNWGFVAKIDQKEAFSPIREIQKKATIATIVILLIVTIISAFIANSIVSPIRYLEKMALRFSRGELDEKIGLKTKGEIGSLANALEKMKNDLTSLQATSLRNEKLAAIGKLSGSVAHDIRNPLGSISNSIYFLSVISKDFNNEQIDKHLRLMGNEIGRVNSIIDDLMDFSREQKPNLAHKNINTLITQLIDRLEPPATVFFTLNLDSELNQCLIDEIQIQRVLLNLINNAIQAMPEGGEIVITSIGRNNEVHIIIQDAGEGINQDKLPYIFEPLFTTKSKGVGLGLSITKTLIEKHQGTIEVQSKLHEGTRFTITLPCGEE